MEPSFEKSFEAITQKQRPTVVKLQLCETNGIKQCKVTWKAPAPTPKQLLSAVRDYLATGGKGMERAVMDKASNFRKNNMIYNRKEPYGVSVWKIRTCSEVADIESGLEISVQSEGRMSQKVLGQTNTFPALIALLKEAVFVEHASKQVTQNPKFYEI